jgi:hypothetical protein
VTLYKVLTADNHSAHGGKLTWSVPAINDDGSWTPGEWHEVAGEVVACRNGLHLTSNPMHWPVCGMRVYEAEGDGASDTDDRESRHKIAYQRARLLRPADDVVPAEYWRKVEAFVADLPTLPWMQPDGNPDPGWQVFPTSAAAYDAAFGAALDAAYDAAFGAARDAALWARVLVCDGLPLDQRHVDHAAARMAVCARSTAACDLFRIRVKSAARSTN